LKIVGEAEEEYKAKIDIDFTLFNKDYLPSDIFKDFTYTEFNIKDAIVFVDPLDGTIDFLNGSLS